MHTIAKWSNICPSRGLPGQWVFKDLIGVSAIHKKRFQASIFLQVVTLLKLPVQLAEALSR